MTAFHWKAVASSGIRSIYQFFFGLYHRVHKKVPVMRPNYMDRLSNIWLLFFHNLRIQEGNAGPNPSKEFVGCV
jgi:hypothetical protein